jgi:hypothetical protein
MSIPKKRVALYDVTAWLDEIKSKGLNKFTFADLKPYKLGNQGFINRAKTKGLVRKIKNVTVTIIDGDKVRHNSLVQWEIVPEKERPKRRLK